jgi:hypothetical protein
MLEWHIEQLRDKIQQIKGNNQSLPAPPQVEIKEKEEGSLATTHISEGVKNISDLPLEEQMNEEQIEEEAKALPPPKQEGVKRGASSSAKSRGAPTGRGRKARTRNRGSG